MNFSRSSNKLWIKLGASLVFLLSAQGLFAVTAGTEGKIGGGYAVTGQIPQMGYTFEVYNAANGLPTSDANVILSSSDGYIWVGGYSGVFRYDGTSFERLPTYLGASSGRGLFEDSKKRLWVATNDNGVVVLYDEKSRRYNYKDGLPSSSVRVFAEDAEGNIFIGTTSGVAYVDTQGRLYTLSDSRINEERILKLDSDSKGKIFGQTKNGNVFAIENCKITEFYTFEELGMEKITTLLADKHSSGIVYLATESSNIYYGSFGKKASDLRKINVAPLKNVHWLSYDCGRLWVSSTSMAGYLDERNRFQELINIPANCTIEMTTSDYQGNIWIASSNQGVIKVVTNNFVNLSDISGLLGETTNATCVHNGKLYIGTDRGLRILNSEKQPVADELSDFLGTSRIRCIVEDFEKNLWLATYTNNMGLVCQSADGKITSFTKEDGLLSNQIRTISIAKDGRVLVGTNGGLAIIKNGRVERTYGSEDGIKNTEFLTVAEGLDGDIYCGSDGDGIYVINDSGVRRIGRGEGLTSDVVMRIKRDEKHELLWLITSNSIGMIKNGVIKNVTSFPYNNNYDIYINDKDEVWILSSYGIYCVAVDNLIYDYVKDYRVYSIANGLPYSITGNSYSALDDDGNLYVAGREGVIRFNINHFFDSNALVKAGISAVFIDDKKISANADGSYTLPSSSKRIKLLVSVLDYTMNNPLVKVFLEGSGDPGITARKNELTPLEYTSLPYGNYALRIQVMGNDGKTPVLDNSVTIIKKPKLLEVLAVRIVIALLVMIIVGLVVWRFMKATVIRRQYSELRQAKDDVERANMARSRFLSNMSQQIITPVNTIMGMNEMIMREDARDVPKTYFMSIMNYAFDIRTASESLAALVSDLFEMTKIETGALELVQTEYDLQDILRSVIIPVRERSLEKGLKFDVNIDEMVPKRLYGDVGKIRQVLLKLLNNAIQYTFEGGFELKLSMEERTDNECGLCFSIKDTGVGIKENEVEGLFSPYGQPGQQFEREETEEHLKTGLGLDISRRFAELMGGVLVCRSVYGEGSEFIFTLTQKIIDPTPIGVFQEHDDSAVERGPYIPQFIAPDADVLVIDSNKMNLEVIKNLLKATKVFITTAFTAEEGLEKIRTSSFNIIFVDQMIVKMYGDDLISKIREYTADIPVYVITENAALGEDSYKAMGYSGCLLNPIDSKLFERIIMRNLPESMMEKPSAGDFSENLAEIPEEMKWVYEVEGLFVEQGIKYSGGAGGFIFGLQLFVDTIEENSRRIDEAYKKGDFKQLEVTSSIVKNSSRFIGAVQLEELAAKMEEACKKDDKIYIASHIDNLLKTYSEFKEKLNKLNGNNQEM
ncbi:MAG: response regulator [Treponema sp.]|nr:response regulator [Treponema sp.]